MHTTSNGSHGRMESSHRADFFLELFYETDIFLIYFF